MVKDPNRKGHAYLDYIVALLGGWSMIAPFVLGYHATVEVARNTDIVIGIAVALIALVSHYYGSPVSGRTSPRDLTPALDASPQR